MGASLSRKASDDAISRNNHWILAAVVIGIDSGKIGSGAGT
jgi:hypothetical protein